MGKWKCYYCPQRSSHMCECPLPTETGFELNQLRYLLTKCLKSETTVLCSHPGRKAYRAAGIKESTPGYSLHWCFGWELECPKPRGLKLLPDSLMFPWCLGVTSCRQAVALWRSSKLQSWLQWRTWNKGHDRISAGNNPDQVF